MAQSFFGCYLLESLQQKNLSYIGFTVDPRRRLRQHNGLIAAGAWKTHKGRPWKMILCIWGLPNKIAALQFEYAWQHPALCRHSREAVADLDFCQRTRLGRQRKVTGTRNNVQVLFAMLRVPPYCRMPLSVHFLDAGAHSELVDLCNDLPEHMKVTQGSFDELEEICAEFLQARSSGQAGACCAACVDTFRARDRIVSCPSCGCGLHVACAAQAFTGVGGRLLPERPAPCPGCRAQLEWPVLLRSARMLETDPGQADAGGCVASVAVAGAGDEEDEPVGGPCEVRCGNEDPSSDSSSDVQMEVEWPRAAPGSSSGSSSRACMACAPSVAVDAGVPPVDVEAAEVDWPVVAAESSAGASRACETRVAAHVDVPAFDVDAAEVQLPVAVASSPRAVVAGAPLVAADVGVPAFDVDAAEVQLPVAVAESSPRAVVACAPSDAGVPAFDVTIMVSDSEGEDMPCAKPRQEVPRQADRLVALPCRGAHQREPGRPTGAEKRDNSALESPRREGASAADAVVAEAMVTAVAVADAMAAAAGAPVAREAVKQHRLSTEPRRRPGLRQERRQQRTSQPQAAADALTPSCRDALRARLLKRRRGDLSVLSI